MITIEEINNMILGNKNNWFKSSYKMFDDKLVRVSNHLPNSSNFSNLNEDVERLFLIFVESDLTELKVQKFIESDLSSYEVDYLIIDEENQFTEEQILGFTNRF